MCRLIILLKTLDETTLLLLSLVSGVNAKIMKKFKVRLNTFFDCQTSV